MENTVNMTMGKRIFYYRKRMGLTQEQLAERLGVTAQAVSKWEHELSCPDVTLLPRLAEIFGITTDELLGLRGAQEAEVKEGIVEERQKDSGKPWHFEWNWGRGDNTILSACFLVLLGAVYLANYLMDWGASFWSILWPMAILYVGMVSIRDAFVFGASCSIMGIYFLLVNTGLIPNLVTWPIVLAVFLMLAGVSLVVGLCRKRRYCTAKAYSKGSRENPVRKYSSADGMIHAEYAFCSDRIAPSDEIFRGGEIEVAFGSVVLDLQDCADVSPDCRLHLDVAFSATVILVPSRFRLEEMELDKAGCGTNVVGSPAPDAKPIILTGECNFGSLKIQYL